MDATDSNLDDLQTRQTSLGFHVDTSALLDLFCPSVMCPTGACLTWAAAWPASPAGPRLCGGQQPSGALRNKGGLLLQKSTLGDPTISLLTGRRAGLCPSPPLPMQDWSQEPDNWSAKVGHGPQAAPRATPVCHHWLGTSQPHSD